MIYAQILNSLIVNVIQIDDVTAVPLFTVGYDDCIQIDTITPQPTIGWSYDGTNFTNQVTLPTITSFEGAPSGLATTFDAFILSAASGGYTVSVNGSVLSIGCQNYDYATVRYLLYMLLTQGAGSMGPFTETSAGFIQNNQFIVTAADVNLIYNALCTLI